MDFASIRLRRSHGKAGVAPRENFRYKPETYHRSNALARPDVTMHRLFIAAPLAAGAAIPLGRAQANYLLNVLRLGEGASLLVFNGRDGEWRAAIAPGGRKSAALIAREQTRTQPPVASLHYLFAPLKHARLDYLVQKAVEMGASHLRPVRTARTQATRLNMERMRANMIEAAEQCGVLNIPEILPEAALPALIRDWDATRILVFCDEDRDIADPVAALAAARGCADLAVLIGPEGGFSPDERNLLLSLPKTIRLSLGPRILRADTAAVAALALVQAVLGDGGGNPPAL